MRLTGKLLAATAIVAASAGTALAADVVIVPPPAPLPPPIVEEPNFDGPYWGVFLGIGDRGTIGAGGPNFLWVGTQFGYNLVFNNFMTGFEIETEHLNAPQNVVVDATLNGRFGLILGNQVLLYGQAGIGTVFNIPAWSVGGGAELALGTHLSVFGEIKFFNFLGAGLPFDAWRLVGGVNYYADPSNLGPGGTFDWGGLYFGAHGGAFLGGPAPLGHFGVQVGYNLGGGPFVGGLEVETSHTFGVGPLINAALNGRAGFAFGNILVYGEVGIGSFIGVANWTAGGGAELALGANFGLFAEAKAAFPLGGGPVRTIVNGGINIHFGH